MRWCRNVRADRRRARDRDENEAECPPIPSRVAAPGRGQAVQFEVVVGQVWMSPVAIAAEEGRTSCMSCASSFGSNGLASL